MNTANVVPCAHCGRLPLDGPCPACRRPAGAAARRDGLFLRTLNQVVAAIVWGPILVSLTLLAAVVAGVLLARLD